MPVLSSSRSARRLSSPMMITLGVVGLLIVALTVISIFRSLSRDDAQSTVESVQSGQALVITKGADEHTIRFMTARAPLPVEDESEESFDTCLADEAREQLEELAPEGTVVDVKMPPYSSAPAGQFWGRVTAKRTDLALEMVRSGYAVPYIEDAEDSDEAQELRDAQQEAFDDKRGIYSKDADCTVPSVIEPQIEELQDLPDKVSASAELDELNAYVSELNALRTDAQNLRGTLSAIPTTGDSVSALGWGVFKEDYEKQADEALEEITDLLEEAQEDRDARLEKDRKKNEKTEEPEAPSEQPQQQQQPLEQQQQQPQPQPQQPEQQQPEQQPQPTPAPEQTSQDSQGQSKGQPGSRPTVYIKRTSPPQ